MAFVNCRELEQMISIPVYSIRKLVRQGKIPAYRIDGKNLLFDPEEVEAVIKNNLIKPTIKSKLSLTAVETQKR